jgi:Phosphotransferase enzyme family
MKINPTPSCLSLVLHAIENAVLPDVTSQSARATLGIITATLTDLLKRQGPSAELVRRCNEKGRNLKDEARQLLDPAYPITSSAPENGLSELAKGFDELSLDHDQLTRDLNDLCVQLSTRCDQTTARFLQRVAEWELIYYEESQTMEVELFSNNKVLKDDIAALSKVQEPEIKAQPLSRETLEEFLRTSRGTPLDVIEFSQMTGGYGKQTYQCSIKNRDRDEIEDLVIRKCDASPIIEAGGFRVEQEFELLRALATTGYPSPKPIELGHNIPGVDGSFYTMNRISGHVPSSFLGIMEMEFSEKLLFQLAELLGKLHSIPLSTFTSFIEKFEEPGALGLTVEGRYRRNIRSWRQYVEKVKHLPSPYLTWLFHWLEQNIPSDNRPSVRESNSSIFLLDL